MILIIIAIVATLLIIMFVLLGIFKNEMFHIGSAIFGIVAFILYVMFFTCLATDKIDKNKYISLSMAAKHWDELTVYEQITMGSEIRQWNDHLNYYNNYWWKFSIEDRSQYIIEIESDNKN